MPHAWPRGPVPHLLGRGSIPRRGTPPSTTRPVDGHPYRTRAHPTIMQETTVIADMDEDPRERPLTDRELAQLLYAHADAIADGDETRERALLDVLQLVARETPNVEQRIDTVGTRGRVSFGRDNAGVHGTALFVPNHVVGASELDGVGPGEDDEQGDGGA